MINNLKILISNHEAINHPFFNYLSDPEKKVLAKNSLRSIGITIC